MLAWVLSLAASAASADMLAPELIKTLTTKLSVPARGLNVEAVRVTPVPNIYEVRYEGGLTVYAAASGDYFMSGDMFSLQNGELVNLGEQRRSKERVAALAEISPDELIVFPAKGNKRATINVFTDITCKFCQLLHKEVPALNEAGVEVRYLAWPRGGLGSKGFSLLATAWCADDKQTAMTKLKNKENLPNNVCPGNPVAKQFELGKELGVNATPAIVMSSGELIPGYQPVDKLLMSLGLK